MEEVLAAIVDRVCGGARQRVVFVVHIYAKSAILLVLPINMNIPDTVLFPTPDLIYLSIFLYSDAKSVRFYGRAMNLLRNVALHELVNGKGSFSPLTNSIMRYMHSSNMYRSDMYVFVDVPRIPMMA